MFDDHSRIYVEDQHQVSLSCKWKSLQKPTEAYWFRRKEENINPDKPLENFIENYKSIKYFENFYEPIFNTNSIKELSENVFLTKLLVSETNYPTQYACVAVNYSGFSFRLIELIPQNSYQSDESYIEKSSTTFQEKSSKILFLLPVLLFLPISIIFCFIIYLLMNRQILKRNKIPETISL